MTEVALNMSGHLVSMAVLNVWWRSDTPMFRLCDLDGLYQMPHTGSNTLSVKAGYYKDVFSAWP